MQNTLDGGNELIYTEKLIFVYSFYLLIPITSKNLVHLLKLKIFTGKISCLQIDILRLATFFFIHYKNKYYMLLCYYWFGLKSI